MSIQPTYLFYDLETTGLNPCFDQILQFAAIRTDLQLNEIERHELFIKPKPNLIPSPYATITHRISLQQAQQGESEYVAINKIHQLFNQPGTISLGYNTLRFDDEFMRFAFYRNLLTPYTHQYADQCHRMDIYPITVMYYLFNPKALNWPMINSNPSLKLENINQQNQLASGSAHNALVDVEVTLALAKKLRSHQKMWDYVIGYFDKKIDLNRVDKLPIGLEKSDTIHRQGLLINSQFGARYNYSAPVLSLGQHQHYKNQSLWLRLDLEELSKTDFNNIEKSTYVVRKRAGEQEILLPPEQRYLEKVGDKRLQLSESNLDWLRQHDDILQAITDYHQHYQYPTVDNIDSDAALYEVGFPTPQQLKLFQQFHQADLNKKNQLLERFANPIYRQLAQRILQRNFAENAATQITKDQTVDFRGQRHYQIEQALADIVTIRSEQTLDQQQLTLLTELENYLQSSSINHSV